MDIAKLKKALDRAIESEELDTDKQDFESQLAVTRTILSKSTERINLTRTIDKLNTKIITSKKTLGQSTPINTKLIEKLTPKDQTAALNDKIAEMNAQTRLTGKPL